MPLFKKKKDKASAPLQTSQGSTVKEKKPREKKSKTEKKPKSTSTSSSGIKESKSTVTPTRNEKSTAQDENTVTEADRLNEDQEITVQLPVICRAEAICGYEPEDLDIDAEISFLKFDKGDMIDVVEQDASGWWEGIVDGVWGIFPGAYVQIVEVFETEEDGEEIDEQTKEADASNNSSLDYLGNEEQSEEDDLADLRLHESPSKVEDDQEDDIIDSFQDRFDDDDEHAQEVDDLLSDIISKYDRKDVQAPHPPEEESYDNEEPQQEEIENENEIHEEHSEERDTHSSELTTTSSSSPKSIVSSPNSQAAVGTISPEIVRRQSLTDRLLDDVINGNFDSPIRPDPMKSLDDEPVDPPARQRDFDAVEHDLLAMDTADSHSARLEELTAQLELKETELHEFKEKYNLSKQQIEQLTHQLNQSQNEVSQARESSQLAQQHMELIRSLQDDLEENQTSIQEISNQLETALNSISELKSQLDDANLKKQELNNELISLKCAKQVEQQELFAIRASESKLQSELTQLQDANANYVRELSELQQKYQQSSHENLELHKEIQHLRAQVQSALDNNAEAQLNQLQTRLDESMLIVRERDATLRDRDNRIQHLTADYAKLTAKLEALETAKREESQKNTDMIRILQEQIVDLTEQNDMLVSDIQKKNTQLQAQPTTVVTVASPARTPTESPRAPPSTTVSATTTTTTSTNVTSPRNTATNNDLLKTITSPRLGGAQRPVTSAAVQRAAAASSPSNTNNTSGDANAVSVEKNSNSNEQNVGVVSNVVTPVEGGAGSQAPSTRGVGGPARGRGINPRGGPARGQGPAPRGRGAPPSRGAPTTTTPNSASRGAPAPRGAGAVQRTLPPAPKPTPDDVSTISPTGTTEGPSGVGRALPQVPRNPGTGVVVIQRPVGPRGRPIARKLITSARPKHAPPPLQTSGNPSVDNGSPSDTAPTDA